MLPRLRTSHLVGILAGHLLFGSACGDGGTPRTTPDAGGSPDLDASQKPSPDAGEDAGADADASAETDASADAAVLSESSFVVQLAAAYCARIESCCAHGTADCVDAMTEQLSEAAATASASGNVFVPAHAAACLAAVEALSEVECVPWFQSTQAALSACSGAFDGTKAPGEECTDVAQCERGTRNGTTKGGFVGCAKFDGEGPMRCRAFEPTTEVGAACEHGFMGDAPHVNVCAGGSAWCTDGMCQPPPACDASHPNGTCDEGSTCVEGVCEALGEDGADCSIVPCARGYECNAAQICEPVPAAPWYLTVGLWDVRYACPGGGT
jgi:hypothetical protein